MHFRWQYVIIKLSWTTFALTVHISVNCNFNMAIKCEGRTSWSTRSHLAEVWINLKLLLLTSAENRRLLFMQERAFLSGITHYANKYEKWFSWKKRKYDRAVNYEASNVASKYIWWMNSTKFQQVAPVFIASSFGISKKKNYFTSCFQNNTDVPCKMA